MNEKFAQAIAGQTVVIPYCEMEGAFLSLADFQNWCNFYQLQYAYNAQTESYTISKTI